MIIRLTAAKLRALADQVDAFTQIMNAGGTIQNLSGKLYVDGEHFAYLHWWEDKQQFLCEFLDFDPKEGDSVV